MSGYQPKKPILKKRTCKRCTTVLSIYNQNKYCYKCEKVICNVKYSIIQNSKMYR